MRVTIDRHLTASLALALLIAPVLALAQEAEPAAGDAPKAGEPEADGPAEPEDGGETAKDNKKQQKDVVEVGGRVHAGFDAEHKQHEDNAWSDTFHIRRARIKISWRPEEWLDARIQADVATAFAAGYSMLKEAFLRVSPFDQLRLRAGLFKKPFSALELTSSGSIKVIQRGLTNELIVDAESGGMFFGDRDIGLELGGRLVDSVDLDYAIGVFNGSGFRETDFDEAKDIVGRLSISPVKQLELGASGALRFYSDDSMHDQGYPRLAAGGEADVQLKLGGFRAHLEGMIAHNYIAAVDAGNPSPDIGDVDLAFGALGILSYKFKLDSSVKLALEPVVKVEYLDPNDRIVDDHAILYTIGLNTYVGKYFRVMLDLEILRAWRFWDIDSSEDDPTTPELEDVEDHKETLMLLLCFDI